MEVQASQTRPRGRTFSGRLVARWMGRLLLVLLGALVVLVFSLLYIAWKPLGKMATGERRKRMELSVQWTGDAFRDVMPRDEPNIWKILPKWFEEPQPFRRPEAPMAHGSPRREDFARPPESGLRITWLGHSTTLIEIDGLTLLTDPVWGEYVAPLELKNAKRFMPPPLPFEELPAIDAVLISHDHYDHLDYPTILRLRERRDLRFIVPLGVGSHLEYWGVSKESITELLWWEETSLGPLRLACTPARHFSGRSLVDRDKTLWAGWAVMGARHRVFFSGDTALFPGFRDIGQKYGPFDATMIETGAYNALWADVHLGPEQAVLAHQMLGGRLLIPIHWGMFDLGLHGWTEPIERTLAAAEQAGVRVATLRPGDALEPEKPRPTQRWWPHRPWQTAAQAPIHSSGM